MCVIFAFKAPIFDIRDAGEFHLSCGRSYKAKEGDFLSSRSMGGLPEKIFDKRMQMVHS